MPAKKQQLKDAMKQSGKSTSSLSKEDRNDLKSAFVSPKKAQKKLVPFRLYENEVHALDDVIETMQAHVREPLSRNTVIRIAIALVSKQKPEKIKSILKKVRVE